MPRRKSIRVLIADDNKTVRRGLRMRLENANGITVAAEASSGTDAVLIAGAERVDVILMDLHMPGLNGIQATRVLAQRGPAMPKVILITSEVSDGFVIEAFEAGVSGYLLKNHDTEQLVDVIRGTVQGTSTISAHVTPRLLRELADRRTAAIDHEALARLTPAERRVIELLSSGVTGTDDIAATLSLSVSTVKSHLGSALKKLSLNDRTQLALWGIRNGLGGGFSRPFG